MTFKEYLRTVRVSETPAFDFVQDAKDDRELPNVTTWQELEIYLRQKNAAPEALAAAKQVWGAYEATGFPRTRTDAQRTTRREAPRRHDWRPDPRRPDQRGGCGREAGGPARAQPGPAAWEAGGAARAKALTAKRRKEIAKKAAAGRWSKLKA